jgi:hypothetical protein
MAYKYKLREEEGAEVSPSNREQVNYDIVVTPNGVSVEDTVKALETLDNYGMYVSNMRNKSSIQKAIEDHFGPIIPAKRKKMERDQGFPFPIKTKTSIDDFVKSHTSKPTLLKYKVKDDTIIFPKSGNPAKDLTKKIIDVVMKSAKVDYSIVDKEAVDESADKLDQEAKLYFMQQFKAGKIKELPKDPKAEYMKIKMTKESSMNEVNSFKSGKEFINIKLQKYPKAIAKINQLISMVGESNFTMEMAEWIFDFFNNTSYESPVNEAKKVKMTKKDLKEVIKEQIKSLTK